MSSAPDPNELDAITAKQQAIEEEIANLKDYVENEPERIRQAQELEREAEEDRLRTIPPPSEVQDRIREQEFMDKLSRGELKNEVRHQTKSGILLFLLILAIFAIGAWIYQALS